VTAGRYYRYLHEHQRILVKREDAKRVSARLFDALPLAGPERSIGRNWRDGSKPQNKPSADLPTSTE